MVTVMKKFLLSALFALLLPWQVEAGTVVFHDTFVDTGGTDLDAHTPDTVGTAWTIVYSTLTQAIEIVGASSTVKAAGDAFNQGAFFSADPAPTAADVDIEVDLEGLDADTDDGIWIPFRYQDANNWYALNMTGSANHARLYKKIGGAAAFLVGQGTTVLAGTETLKLQVRGSTFDLFVDSGSGYGSSEMTKTISEISSAGKTGLAWAAWSTDAFISGWDLSTLNIVTEYKVTEFPAAGGGAFLPGASVF